VVCSALRDSGDARANDYPGNGRSRCCGSAMSSDSGRLGASYRATPGSAAMAGQYIATRARATAAVWAHLVARVMEKPEV